MPDVEAWALVQAAIKLEHCKPGATTVEHDGDRILEKFVANELQLPAKVLKAGQRSQLIIIELALESALMGAGELSAFGFGHDEPPVSMQSEGTNTRARDLASPLFGALQRPLFLSHC